MLNERLQNPDGNEHGSVPAKSYDLERLSAAELEHLIRHHNWLYRYENRPEIRPEISDGKGAHLVKRLSKRLRTLAPDSPVGVCMR